MITPSQKAEMRELAQRLQEVGKPLSDRAAAAIFALLDDHDRLEKLACDYSEIKWRIFPFYGDSEHPPYKDRLIDAVNRMADRAEAAEAKLAKALEGLKIVDDDVRHHTRSEDIPSASLLRRHAIEAVREALQQIGD